MPNATPSDNLEFDGSQGGSSDESELLVMAPSESMSSMGSEMMRVESAAGLSQASSF